MEFLSSVPAGGTLFNAAAIIAGGSVGLLLGRFIPEKAYNLIFQCLGLFCLYIGFTMANKTQNVLVVMFALLTGAVAGSLLDIDGALSRWGDSLKRIGGGEKSGYFTQAFVATSILYCVGSMSVIGAIEDGLKADSSLLVVKSCMDGTASIMFAASMGVGALFSAIPLLLYQGSITFAARLLSAFITTPMMDNLSGLGGLIIVGLGLNMLKMVEIKTSNLLPGVAFVLIFSAFSGGNIQ